MDKKYKEQISIHEKIVNEYSKKSNMIGNLKLLLCLILVAIVIFRFSDGIQMFFPVTVIFIVLAFLWAYHAKIIAKLERSKILIKINQKYLSRIDGTWIQFKDNAEEFANPEHRYACDLDIVGEKSLFQLLNVANTYYGRERFVKDLLESDYSQQELLKRQEAIAELSKDILFSNEFQYISSQIKPNKDVEILLENLKKDSKFINNNILRVILKYLPLVTVPFIALTLIFQVSSLYAVAVNVVMLQLFMWIFGVLKMIVYFSSVGAAQYSLNNYSKLLEFIQTKDFESDVLKEVKTKLVNDAKSAATAIAELEKIMQRINLRYNTLLYIILNAFLLWDYECAFSLEKWKLKYAREAELWFRAIAEFESLLSFSNLSNINENTCFPNITLNHQQKNIYSAKNLGHPLLSNDGRIYNDIDIDGNILIISGSNMSGKTTFLRTVGINLVLAQAGCCVCADNMSNSIFKIATSMRITDDLGNGVSTFYAELKKIKTIIDICQEHNNTLFLIDEIFRGTNSVDRLEGARAVLTNLHELSVAGLITTHDLELCSLSETKNFLNFSFSEYYENNEIKFDYKIKAGKSTTTNAKYLMEMIGIRRSE